MRKLYIIISLVILGCSENEYPFTIPLVITDEVTEITNFGAVFNAHFEDFGSNDPISLYGFVWSTGDPSLKNFKRTFTGQPPKSFKSTVTRNITLDTPGGTITGVRAFAITASGKIYYGNIVKFAGKGTRPPKLESISPAAAFDGEEVTITASNAGFLPNIAVKLYYTPATPFTCEKISVADSVIKIKIPPTTLAGTMVLSISDGYSFTITSFFKITGPHITKSPKSTAKAGETLVLDAEYLDKATVLDVYFGSGSSFEKITSKKISDTQLEVVVPKAPSGGFGFFEVRSKVGTVNKTARFETPLNVN